jgi:site-specific DNA recombinase
MTIFGYIRLSVRESDEGTSLKSQRAAIQAYADAHGEAVEFLSDDGFSGRSTKRPAYQELRRRLAEPGLTAIVCRSVDRLGRNLKEFLVLVDEAAEHGIFVVATASSIDTSTSAGKMFTQLLGVFAEAESSAIGERQVYSQRERRKQGRSIGVASYGYQSQDTGSGSFKVIVEQQANIILTAAEAVLAGGSIYSAARSMNDAGETTSRGNPWAGISLRRLLSNPSIAGLRHHQGQLLTDDSGALYHDKHLEIVPLARWRKLQEVLQSRKTNRVVGEAGDQLLLSGVARCGSCSGTFIKGSRRNQPPRYRCRNLENNKCAQGVTISVEKLDAYVLEQLEPLAHMPVFETVTTEAPENIIQRETLTMQISDAMESLGQATHDQVAEIAVRISELKQSLSMVPISTSETAHDTGATFGDLLHESPELVVSQALEAVMVYPPATPRSRLINSDRVTLVWREYLENFDD